MKLLRLEIPTIKNNDLSTKLCHPGTQLSRSQEFKIYVNYRFYIFWKMSHFVNSVHGIAHSMNKINCTVYMFYKFCLAFFNTIYTYSCSHSLCSTSNHVDSLSHNTWRPDKLLQYVGFCSQRKSIVQHLL